MSLSEKTEWIELLLQSKISDFNEWRFSNLTVRPDISKMDFSNRDMSGAALNGVRCVETNFSGSNLSNINLVQAEMTSCNFDGANLTDALMMYGELKKSSFVEANLMRTNFMWADLRECDFTGSKMTKAVFVEAKLQFAKLENIKKNVIYLKFAKLDGTNWAGD
jgi:uncharacterized protein YjbI with pentapeptide repeats